MITERIKYFKELYRSEDIRYSDLLRIKHCLEKQPQKANVFLITIATNEQEQLDILHSKYLIQPYYKEKSLYIIGLAKKKKDAMAIVEQMMQECVNTRGDANLKAYLIGE